jgi:hypothetical protein
MLHDQWILSGPTGRSATTGSRAGGGGIKKEVSMLETIIVVLLVLWALGFFAFHVGGLVHVLLVIALVIVVMRLLQGKKIL